MISEKEMAAYLYARELLFSAKRHVEKANPDAPRRQTVEFDIALGKLRTMVREAWSVPFDLSIEKFIELQRQPKWIPTRVYPAPQCKKCGKSTFAEGYGHDVESGNTEFICNPCMSLCHFSEGLEGEICGEFFNAGHHTCGWMKGHYGPHSNFSETYGQGGYD